MKRAAFLDRDGVINRNAPKGHYNVRWEDIAILPGVADAIVLLKAAGFLAIVVTNQRCVAKGLITTEELNSLHRRLWDHLASAGAKLDAIYYCPHELDAGCSCRKPAPGMLLEASRDHGIDLGSSWMIGDSTIDVEAGKRAGCRTIQILDGKTETSSAADRTATSLIDAVHRCLASSQFV